MPSVKEIAEKIGAEIEGSSDVIIKGVASLTEASENEISFLANPKYASQLSATKAGAVIVSYDVECKIKTLLRCKNPYLGFALALELLNPPEEPGFKGIHSTCIIGEGAEVAISAVLMPYVVIGKNVKIGERTVIYPFVYIGNNSEIGSDSLVYANVSIREKIKIGSKVIIHSSAVIGSDGFGFAPDEERYHKIPQIGKVIIEDDVEIGAGVCIDRAALAETVIGKGTKIDNLVQIGHNCIVGENSIIVSQVGLSGSVTLGKHVTLAGQVGVAGHISIGNNSIVGAKSGVAQNIPENVIYFGIPARDKSETMRIYATLPKLPQLSKELKKLEKKVEELEEKLKRKS